MRRGWSRALLVALAGAALVAACQPARETRSCRRLDVPSLGPENGLRTRVALEPAPVVSAPDGRIEIALTAVPAPTGPVLLVHTQDDREVGRWELTLTPSSRTVSRCVLGFGPSASTSSNCGATLAGPSHAVSGEWRIEAGDQPVLEASVSFRLCD